MNSSPPCTNILYRTTDVSKVLLLVEEGEGPGGVLYCQFDLHALTYILLPFTHNAIPSPF